MMGKPWKQETVFKTCAGTNQGVLLQLIDGPEGVAYQISMTWEEFDDFLKKHGRKMPIGELGRAGQKHMRDMMEMDPEG